MSTDDLKMRSELKSKFETGDRPSGEDFAQMIDSALNQRDDRIFSVNSKIGIGTQFPSAPLEVYGSALNAKQSFLSSDGYNSTFRVAHPEPNMLVMGSNDKQEFRIGQFKEDGSFFNTKMIVDAHGSVGIGNALPQAKLHVQGDLKVDTKLSLGECELVFYKGRLILFNEGIQYNVRLEKPKQKTADAAPFEDTRSFKGVYTLIAISWVISFTALAAVIYHHFSA